MTGDAGDERRREGGGGGIGGGKGPTRPVLSRVDGPTGDAPPLPPVSLHREWKGLTVADLLRQEIVDRLPGQVRSALFHLQRGDLEAAERALPGEFAPVLPGPGHRRAERRAVLAWLALAAVVVAIVAIVGWC